MKFVIYLFLLLFCYASFANDQKLIPSPFNVITLNSPVKEGAAKFKMDFPSGFEIEKIKIKLVNAYDLKKGQRKFEDIDLVGNELRVGISKLPPGFYQLYITVQDKKSHKELVFQNKYRDFVRFVIADSVEVPMPDPKMNNTTIKGIDSDNDGIRDDIQRYINEKYAGNIDQKLALKQFATQLQENILTVGDKELNISSSKRLFDSLWCIGSVFGIKAVTTETDSLRSKLLNTIDRIKANEQANRNFGGQLYEAPDLNENLCNFDIASEGSL